MTTETAQNLRAAAFRRLNRPAPPALHLPPDCPPDTFRPAGCGTLLVLCALAWAGILAAAWMVAGWIHLASN